MIATRIPACRGGRLPDDRPLQPAVYLVQRFRRLSLHNFCEYCKVTASGLHAKPSPGRHHVGMSERSSSSAGIRRPQKNHRVTEKTRGCSDGSHVLSTVSGSVAPGTPRTRTTLTVARGGTSTQNGTAPTNKPYFFPKRWLKNKITAAFFGICVELYFSLGDSLRKKPVDNLAS